MRTLFGEPHLHTHAQFTQDLTNHTIKQAVSTLGIAYKYLDLVRYTRGI